MYYPEANCPFYRVTYLSNYSPYMTPDNKNHYSLLCETSYSEFKPVDGKTIVDDTIQGLVNSGMIKEQDKHDIVDTWVYHADYSYPTPSVERDGILAHAIPFLESHGIYSRGRFGMWKYEVSNTDHTLMQGVELVNRWLLDEPETTIGIKYESTLDGRQAANHERSHHAGSGDPKKAKELVGAGGVLSLSKGTAKSSPEPAVSRHPGKPEMSEMKPDKSGGPGDKAEVHVSEEELGVTTPRHTPRPQE
jgi:hypothetical protein